MLRPTFHATPEKICAPGLNEALRAEFLRFRNNTVLQNSKRSKTFKRMCVLRDVVTLSPSSFYFCSMWVPRPSLGQSKKAVGGTKTSFSRYKFIETFGENQCFTFSSPPQSHAAFFLHDPTMQVGTMGLPVPSQRLRFARGTRLIQRSSERVPSS